MQSKHLSMNNLAVLQLNICLNIRTHLQEPTNSSSCRFFLAVNSEELLRVSDGAIAVLEISLLFRQMDWHFQRH